MHPYDKLLKINGESIGDMGCKEVHDKGLRGGEVEKKKKTIF